MQRETLDRMMDSLDNLFANNVSWSNARVASDPGFFARLAKLQAPRYLWIGCSDSRVPANEIIGLDPGEVFVHRNVANVVVHSDLNCLSVLQFAVDVLKVEHIMVVGHYGCGGVHAVAENQTIGLADNWLRHVEDVALKHCDVLHAQPDSDARDARLCELNVVEQVGNVCRTTIIRQAWDRGQKIEVHALVFGLRDGLLRRLGTSVDRADAWARYYEAAVADIRDDAKSFIRTHLGP
jgi:carbonic anhydrase